MSSMTDGLAGMPKYEAYKDSGEDWIGEVPSGWEVKSIKFIFQERKEKNDPIKTRDILSLCMYRGVIPYAEKGAAGNKAKEDLTAYRLAYPGDIVMNSMNVVAGSVGLSKYFGVVSPVYYMLRPRKDKDLVEYFNAIFQNEAFQKSLVGLGNGILVKKSELTGKLNTIRMRIPMSKLNMVGMPYPSPAEQTAIVAFLDRKTAQIDQAVAIKEKQITLLKERKQILIQNAVTRGLDPGVPMNDSGVEWIGEIPVHWVTRKIKYLSKIFRGKFTHRPRNDPALYDGLHPFFQTGDVAAAGKHLYKYKQTLNERGLRVSTLIPKGTIVITIAANVGDVSILDLDACFPDSVVGFQPDKKIERDYLYYSLGNMKEQFISSSIKNTQMNLNVERIGSNSICEPPQEEQLKIVEYIESESAKINKAIALQQQQINKLKEYKTTLINSAVTGKIKVPSASSCTESESPNSGAAA